ncbi:hypothetical protein [Halomonas elongata]|uniref:hypothetical protein n=1 Tax=Halomonas elongata TaxID=2746 RepID=UPI00186B907B|nr:hypothetical protein [Halomonas elongata]MBW5801148.1 hypothetical protein [Halomonas elongata]
MPRTWKEWTTRELAILDRDYPAGVPAREIAQRVGHSERAVRSRAELRGLKHPAHSSAQAVRNFEVERGQRLADIAREYRDHRLSRTTLAHDIGIELKTLRRFLPDDLWKSWPRMTIGRIDEARHRRKAA